MDDLNYHKELYHKIEERAISRLGNSVSYLCRAKIRVGKFKALYSMLVKQYNTPNSSKDLKTSLNLKRGY